MNKFLLKLLLLKCCLFLIVNTKSQTTFSNSNSITISTGVAPVTGSIYPSNIAVSGLSGTITKLTITINNFSHTDPRDVDMLLIGPGGQSLVFWADAGGNSTITNQTVIIDDNAASLFPELTTMASGTLKPTNYGATEDAFPTPAPAGPFNSAAPFGSSTLQIFNGTNPNGTWSLYVLDDETGDGGSISGGWSLTLTLATPVTIPLIISEFRLRGVNGENDEYIEIYNTSNTAYTVASASGTGLGIAASDAAGTRGFIPNGTTIPPHGHYLIVNSTPITGYSLPNYGASGAAAGNATYTTDIPDNTGIALFNNNLGGASYSLANRLDAVGSSTETNTLYKEGSGYAALSPLNLQAALRRKSYSAVPQDSDNNAIDFEFVDNAGTLNGGQQRLGAPGPENLNSPVSRNANVIISRLDQNAGALVAPNMIVSLTPGSYPKTLGTLELRYKITNNTGAPITRLRLRIDSISTKAAGSDSADLRPITSTTLVGVGPVNDPGTCSPASAPCNVTVQATTLEEPPVQSNGGGFNSTLAVTLGTPLGNGESVFIRLLFGIEKTGKFSIAFTPEVLPATAGSGPVPLPEKLIGIVGTVTPPSPSVTINQASAQADPTSASPINFIAVFSQAVTGFTPSDVTLSGTAGATTVVITEITPNNGTTYNIAVSGMSTSGSVIATIPAGVVLNSGNVANTASTSTDNTVSYTASSPAPTITCPANTSVIVNSNCLGTFTLTPATVTVTGSPSPTISYNWTIFPNYPPGSTQGSVSNISGPVNISGPPGGISITATATNSAGTASCNFNVSLVDNVAPVVVCANRTAVADENCLADVGYGFLLSDNCTNFSPIVYSSSLFSAGGTSTGGPILLQRRLHTGVYHDTIRVNDFNGNHSTCPYTITVEDKMAPVFVSTTCQNITINTGPSSTDCGAVVEFLPVARDNCDGLATVTTSIPSGSVFPVGNTPVIATATDASGNTAQCSFTVTVVDRTPPTINCPGPQTLYTDANSCSIRLPDYRNLASDNCVLATVVQTPLVGHEFQPGTYTISVVAVDQQGNFTECRIPITVVDNIPPTITCPADKIVNVEPGQCYALAANVSLGLPIISDACPLIRGIIPRRSDGQLLNANYPAGITTITWTASDVYFNTSTCTQTVTVIDNEPPVITNVAANPVTLWPPNHKMKDVEVGYSSTDRCGVVTCRLEVSSNEPINGTGDGDTSPDWEIIDDHHVKLRAERAANGDGRIYTITIICGDEQGNETRETVTVRVAHNITAPQSGKPFKIGSTVSFAGEFWDKPGNTHTAKWLVDGLAVANGIVTEPSGNHKGKITGAYKFKSAGVYKLQMNVTDQTGVTSYANTNEDVDAIVVIYDPNGGNTYGGGHFDSPAGALISNSNATGKASYGFAMNYFKNSTNPKGETQFEFKVGDFEYNALNFDYLVISSSMAQFRGTGKIIGGQSGIAFIMTVVDGELDGTGIDKIRMKIYNKNNGKVIYDNQPGASDAALPIQGVGANSTIVISGTNASLTKSNTTTQNVEMESADKKVPDELEVSVYPNPASSYFNIIINSNDTKGKIVLQVVDQYGRSIETKANLTIGSAVRIGNLYRPGVYYIRVLQGKQHKEIKLIKLAD